MYHDRAYLLKIERWLRWLAWLFLLNFILVVIIDIENSVNWISTPEIFLSLLSFYDKTGLRASEPTFQWWIRIQLILQNVSQIPGALFYTVFLLGLSRLVRYLLRLYVSMQQRAEAK